MCKFSGCNLTRGILKKVIIKFHPLVAPKIENGYLTTEVFIFFKQGSWLRPTTVLQTVAAFKLEL